MNKRRHIDYENIVATMNKELAANKNDVDRFSALPDCLVGRILSCLPTLQAVRTMLISKRFRNSWTWIDTLVFKEEIYGAQGRTSWNVFEGKKFRKLVSQVLNLLQNSKVRMFYLKCYGLDGKIRSEVDTWLQYVLTNKQVKVCFIEFGRQGNHTSSCGIVPPCTFISSFLIWLKLRLCEVHILESVQLDSLRKLSLSKVAIEDKALKNIICGCPSLRFLEISSCPNLISLEVPSSSLQTLSLSELSLIDDSLKNIFNGCPFLRVLRITMCRNLRSFVFPNSIKRLSLNFRFYNAKLRFNCPNLRFLSLESWSPVEIIDISPVIYSSIIIPFTEFKSSLENVRYLKKITLYGSLENMYLSCEKRCPKSNRVLDGEVLHHEPWICCLLRNSSHLEELTIEDSDFHPGGGSEFDGQVIESYDIELDAECLRNHLRKVTFGGCKKTFQIVVHMAQLILKNARVLEVFTVTKPTRLFSASRPLNRMDKRVIRRKIEAVSVASRHVKIDLQ